MSKAVSKQITITWRALTQRVDRALAKKDQRLVALRGTGGGYTVVEPRDSGVAQAKRVWDIDDLEAAGRELGAVKPYERVDRTT